MDDLTNTRSIYLEDSNEIKYYAYSNEIISSLLKVNKGFSTQIDIKFSKEYSTNTARVNSIVFSEVNLNSDEELLENEKVTIIIDL